MQKFNTVPAHRPLVCQLIGHCVVKVGIPNDGQSGGRIEMASKWKWIALGTGVAVVAVGLFSQLRRVEEPKYAVVETSGPFEIRDYPPLIVAEATVKGPRTVAINEGFRVIANYIFGNNISAEKVAMTAPVTQQASEKVAMTAPVTQQAEGDGWTVRFIMPSQYSLETLPKPKSPAVTLKKIESQRMAVIRFSGSADDKLLSQKTQELETFISAGKRAVLSPATFAFYDPPWTLGLLRRNEVMIEIAK
jgi:SOUL heme-binding protein